MLWKEIIVAKLSYECKYIHEMQIQIKTDDGRDTEIIIFKARGQHPGWGWDPEYSPGIMRPSGWPKPAGSPRSERGRGDLRVTLLSDSREETRSWLAASAASSNLGSLQEVC